MCMDVYFLKARHFFKMLFILLLFIYLFYFITTYFVVAITAKQDKKNINFAYLYCPSLSNSELFACRAKIIF